MHIRALTLQPAPDLYAHLTRLLRLEEVTAHLNALTGDRLPPLSAFEALSTGGW